MKHKYVWISTRGHLEEFCKIIKSGTKTRKFFGAYIVPKDYPHISGFFGLVRTPVIFIARGTLTIDNTKITFIGRDFFDKNKFEFTINKSSDFKVSEYTFKSPINKIFNSDWINLESPELGQGLLLMKGLGINYNYEKTTRQIKNELVKWRDQE